MKYSIVIPAFNNGDHLDRTLHYLGQQKLGPCLEVVVVDDGSSEPLRAIVDKWIGLLIRLRSIELKFIRLERNEESSRSKARNAGLRASTGDVITLIDNGVLLADTFFEEMDRLWEKHDYRKTVCLHYILGLFADCGDESTNLIDKITPDTLSEIALNLKQDLQWRDRREEIFNIVNGDLSLLASPWTLAWSAALSISRELLDTIGGFDETFKGWGGEDVDLAYSAYRNGARFLSSSKTVALHIPHVSNGSLEEKIENNRKNILKLHRKKYLLDTEMLIYYPSLYISQVVARYSSMDYDKILPPYGVDVISFICKNLILTTTRSVVIGATNTNMIRELGCTNIFVQTESIIPFLNDEFPEMAVDYRLGLDTPYPDEYFDVIILTDFYRMLGDLILGQLVRELYRISHRVVFIHTDGFQSVVQRLEGWAWHSLEHIRALIDNAGEKVGRGYLGCSEIHHGEHILLIMEKTIDINP